MKRPTFTQNEDLMNFNGSDKSLKKIIDAKMAKNTNFQLFSVIFSINNHLIFMKFCVQVCLQGGHDPKVRGTVGARHLKILNPIIFGHLAPVLANGNNDDDELY